MADLGDSASRSSKTSSWPMSPLGKPAKSSEPQSATNLGLPQQRGVDHKISHRRGLSRKEYPSDCPTLAVQWFFAVDVPKRKPSPAGGKALKSTAGPPKKYAAFSKKDSRAIESAFQTFAIDSEAADRKRLSMSANMESAESTATQAAHVEAQDSDSAVSALKVPVNEDFLFDVDIEHRELGPAYWLGPVYDVRRGTWFGTDGIPCEENLAAQLEEGYVQLAPWRFPQTKPARARPRSAIGATDIKSSHGSPLTPKASSPMLRVEDKPAEHVKPESAPESTQSNTHRLFGPYSNSLVTYQDAVTAWMTTDDLLSRVSGSVYQRFAGGSHLSGARFTRGYIDPSKKNDKPKTEDAAQKDPETVKGSPGVQQAQVDADGSTTEPKQESKQETLARHMTAMVASQNTENAAEQEEEVRKRDEKEIQNDYANRDNEEQNRDIEHLLLVTHGIGQRLGLRLETVNFIGDVNTLRKTLKSVYGQSADLQALNSEIDALPKNCRIQVLPINWRHRLDFPKQSLKHNRGESDLADARLSDDVEYPSLEDITVDGVPAVRNLITDLALDILLYKAPAYKDHIARIVVEECNKIYQLFCKREPTFKGKISFIGHSLGSAIMFDILCRQDSHSQSAKHAKQFKLDFEVEDFYALGSPIGLFQMLEGKTIAARQPAATDPLQSDIPVSTPKCAQVYNIFHPADPISYRIEPLISPAMASLKPQLLPYTKRSLFDLPGQGLTSIGTRVGQSVSGLWSSFSTGIASSLLNRSLGISTEDELKLRSSASSPPSSLGAGTNIAAGVIDAKSIKSVDEAQKAGTAHAMSTTAVGEHPPTLLNGEIETLYAGSKRDHGEDESDDEKSLDRRDAADRAKKLKKEDAKVRALNSNGRVDYSIQEGAFDISLIAAVASHLSYWSDEDCAHFMISQLLSQHRVAKTAAPSESSS